MNIPDLNHPATISMWWEFYIKMSLTATLAHSPLGLLLLLLKASIFVSIAWDRFIVPLLLVELH